MKQYYFIVLFIGSLFFGEEIYSQPSAPDCIKILSEKISRQHHVNPCSGGEKLLYTDVYSYHDTTLYQLIFENSKPCPDFINSTTYYDSACNIRIQVSDGGIAYRHTINPPGTDTRLLHFIVRLPAPGLSAAGKSDLSLKEGGQRLHQFYLSLDVEHLWLSGHHINWESGVADKPDASSSTHTHCSAFAAAACKKLNIYILRPPEHKQDLLSNAQSDWLASQAAANAGWKIVGGNDLYENAQSLANKGMVVVAICKNPDDTKPGHVALVMPYEMTKEKLADEGPALIMAGTHNHNRVSLKAGFKSHLSGWPEHEVLFYYNTGVPAL